MSEEKPFCSNCMFFDKKLIDGQHLKKGQGICRRFPSQASIVPVPQGPGTVAMHKFFEQPIMQEHDWCGEFEQDARVLMG